MSPEGVESLRRSYRPDQVRLLLVGESPPASGQFFCLANSLLYRATRDAFARVYGHDWPAWGGFLGMFKSLGCYLDDLCLEPVNKLPFSERLDRRSTAASTLADRIRDCAPQAIASLMYEIHGHVCSAARLANAGQLVRASLSFPMGRNVHAYRDELEGLLRRLVDERVLPHESGDRPDEQQGQGEPNGN